MYLVLHIQCKSKSNQNKKIQNTESCTYANWLHNNPYFSNRATTACNIKMIQGNCDLDYNTVKH